MAFSPLYFPIYTLILVAQSDICRVEYNGQQLLFGVIWGNEYIAISVPNGFVAACKACLQIDIVLASATFSLFSIVDTQLNNIFN